MSCKYYCIDETMIIVTKKLVSIMLGLFCASLAAYIHNVTFSRYSVTTSYSKNRARCALNKKNYSTSKALLEKAVVELVNKFDEKSYRAIVGERFNGGRDGDFNGGRDRIRTPACSTRTEH